MNWAGIFGRMRFDIVVGVALVILFSFLNHVGFGTRSAPAKEVAVAIAQIDSTVAVVDLTKADTDTLKTELRRLKIKVDSLGSIVASLKAGRVQ